MSLKENFKIQKNVQHIISQIRLTGDKALVGFTAKFDNLQLTPSQFKVSNNEIKKSLKKLDPKVLNAIKVCANRIKAFHLEEKKRIPKSWSVTKQGVGLGQSYRPIESVGIYVPGGRFSYPSTVLMTAIPAKVAGVKKIIIVTPPGKLSAEILGAAQMAGVDAVYQVGGPAAVSALAIGTKTIPKVDLILGPGNAYVTEAKRQLFGEVGIDLLAGPSELVVLADKFADPSYVAADLAAQAEHDPDSTGVLISLDSALIQKVKNFLPKNLLNQCQFIYEPLVNKAIQLTDAYAGEHVEILMKNSKQIFKKLKNGGTFFLSPWSPAVMGDYWAGPSHVLPTGRSARFASGLSVMTFFKRSSFVDISKAAFMKGFSAAHKMAEREGLIQHAKALKVRV
ncbi:MAG: histidinol dehydrogenase [Elusimicrobiota bacterium]